MLQMLGSVIWLDANFPYSFVEPIIYCKNGNKITLGVWPLQVQLNSAFRLSVYDSSLLIVLAQHVWNVSSFIIKVDSVSFKTREQLDKPTAETVPGKYVASAIISMDVQMGQHCMRVLPLVLRPIPCALTIAGETWQKNLELSDLPSTVHVKREEWVAKNIIWTQFLDDLLANALDCFEAADDVYNIQTKLFNSRGGSWMVFERKGQYKITHEVILNCPPVKLNRLLCEKLYGCCQHLMESLMVRSKSRVEYTYVSRPQIFAPSIIGR